MCYMLYVSTSSRIDLSRYNSEYLRFGPPERGACPQPTILENEYKWFVGSMSECSCTFRRLAGGDLGFDDPQDSLPEDEDEIKATAELYRVIASLVQAGCKVDTLNIWLDDNPVQPTRIPVSLAEVSKKAFRFFENYHFVFEP